MNEERLLNIEEAARFLGKSEEQIKDLVKNGKLIAYQIGGMYLRFRLQQLQEFKKSLDASLPLRNRQARGKHLQYTQKSSFFGSVRDFFYFNDFYILASLIIIALLYIILRNIS